MDAEKIRVQGKWKAYLDEWIDLRDRFESLDNAMSAEFDSMGIISFDKKAYSKLDAMHGIENYKMRSVPKFMLYEHGEDIADALDLEIYEFEEADMPNFSKIRFFIYRGYEFFWLR